MYTNAEKKHLQTKPTYEPSRAFTDAVPSGGPNSAMLSMLDSSTLEGGSASDLDQQMRARLALDGQIPSAEREADRLASSVSGARTPEEVKSRLGEKMGADFSNVHFHTDASAVGKADDIGARAYTTGQDIYFGQGGFDPAVAAHELVHTVQQGVVESAMPTVAAPMGGVQMKPNIFQRIKNFFRRGSKSKNKKNLEKISSVSVPSRAGEQQPHLPFTQKQIDNMQNSSNGVRSDSTIEERIRPVTSAMSAEMSDYFGALEQSGFNFGAANKKVNEWTPEGSPARVTYNDHTIATAKKLLSMFSSHLDRPEMQDMLGDVYKNEMRNPGKTPGVEGYSKMEGRFLKNIMSKGLMPLGSQIRKAASEGNEEKISFFKNAQGTTAYLETMWGKEDLPEQLQDLMAAYAPIREKMLSGGRSGLDRDPEAKDALRRQYAATSAPESYDPDSASPDEELAQNLRNYNNAVERGSDISEDVFRRLLPRHLR